MTYLLRTASLAVCSTMAIVGLAGSADAAMAGGSYETSLQFSNLGRLSAFGSGTGVATVNGSSFGGAHMDSFTPPLVTSAALDTVIAVTDPIVTAGGIVEVRLTSILQRPDLQGGVFAPISGVQQNTALQLTQNTMPASGQVRLCLFFAGCNSGSLTLAVGETSNGVYVGAGVGGLLTIGGEGAIRISIFGAPWTVKTVSVSNRTDNGAITFFSKQGFAHGPASLSSSTAATSGVVQLVTANQTTTVGVPGNSDRSGQISEFRMHFVWVPEPGSFLLLGSGAAGLALLGARRRRR